jgi:hypothetical protein
MFLVSGRKASKILDATLWERTREVNLFQIYMNRFQTSVRSQACLSKLSPDTRLLHTSEWDTWVTDQLSMIVNGLKFVDC